MSEVYMIFDLLDISLKIMLGGTLTVVVYKFVKMVRNL